MVDRYEIPVSQLENVFEIQDILDTSLICLPNCNILTEKIDMAEDPMSCLVWNEYPVDPPSLASFDVGAIPLTMITTLRPQYKNC